MKIYIASDHAAYQEKDLVVELIKELGHTVDDLGPNSGDSVHYPEFAVDLCNNLLKNEKSRGILMCGSGIGMSIVANKFKGIRAALCHDATEAKLSRQHNDANVLCIGARTTDIAVIKSMVQIWLSTESEHGRHDIRREMIAKLGQ